MSQSTPPAEGSPPDPVESATRPSSGWTINEDWAAFGVGLVLLLAALVGIIPNGLIP